MEGGTIDRVSQSLAVVVVTDGQHDRLGGRCHCFHLSFYGRDILAKVFFLRSSHESSDTAEPRNSVTDVNNRFWANPIRVTRAWRLILSVPSADPCKKHSGSS